MSSRSNFVLGVLVGGIAGAVTALLYAPQEGSKTRDQIKQKGHDVQNKATEVVGTVKESAQKAADKGKATYQEKRTQVREAVEAGRRAAAEKRAELASKTSEPKPSM